MDYPRKLRLDPTTQVNLISYLNTELTNHNAERGNYINELEAYQDLYWAKPIGESTDTGPIRNGSLIIIPLIAISVEALHARNMTTLFALTDFSQVTLPDQYEDIDKGLEKLLDHEIVKNADMYNFADNVLLEGTKYGTGIGKTGYEKINRKIVKELPDGSREYIDVTIRKGLTVDPVANADFIMPYAYQDPQTAPWCGEEHEMSTFRIKEQEEAGLFEKGTYEKLLSYYQPLSPETPGAQFKQNQSFLENKQPVLPKTIRFYEIWLTFNIDGDEEGKQREIMLYYHYYAQLPMGVYDNPNEDLHRPYRHYNHFKVEHRWGGIGICKQLDQFQIEVTTQHRQRIDNATLANLRMFKVKKLSGFSPDEPLFPGKMWFVDDMDDVETIQMGEVYPSSYNNEQQAVLYAQQRSANNELTMGMQQVGTPGTASSDLARIQESNRRFDYTYKNINQFISLIELDSLCIIKQYGVRSASIYQNIPNGEAVRQFIETVPYFELREQIAIGVKIVGQNQNKLLDRTSWVQIAQTLTGYYTNMLTLAQQSGNPKLLQLITSKAFSAAGEGMKQILESFDVRNINKIIITPEDLASVGIMPSTLNGNEPTAIPGGVQSIIGSLQAPGMGNTNPINLQVGGTGV